MNTNMYQFIVSPILDIAFEKCFCRICADFVNECVLSIKYGSHLTENKRTWHCKSCVCFHFANDGQEKHYWDNNNIVDRDRPSNNPFQLLLEINLMEKTFRYFFKRFSLVTSINDLPSFTSNYKTNYINYSLEIYRCKIKELGMFYL